jgi:MFS family permease
MASFSLFSITLTIAQVLGFLLLGGLITALFPPFRLLLVSAITFVIGITLGMMNIPAQTLMQEQAPEEEWGRVFSFQAMLYNAGSIPVLLFAGVIADTLGIETVMYLLAAAILGFSWWMARYSHHSFVSLSPGKLFRPCQARWCSMA